MSCSDAVVVAFDSPFGAVAAVSDGAVDPAGEVFAVVDTASPLEHPI
jgi:hypothetical protein